MTSIKCIAQYDGMPSENPRRFDFEEGIGTLRYRIIPREVTSAEAPVAARVPQSTYFPAAPGSRIADIRVRDGMFFRQIRDLYGQAVTPGQARLHSSGGLWFGVFETRYQARDAIIAATPVLVIDGEFWERTTMPVITVRGHRSAARPLGDVSPGTAVYGLTEEAAALDAARASYLNAPHADHHTQAPVEVLIPSAFAPPAESARRRAGEQVKPAVQEAFASLDEPTSESLRDAARKLVAAAADYDAMLIPR